MANEPVVKEFNKALFSMRESKVAISKQKIIEITKASMNALRFFKHVVLAVEKFIQKNEEKYKLPAFYVIDSIVRQGIKQHKEKDVFGPRFAINLLKTLENGLNCSDEDKLKIVRVVNLWKTHNVFASDVTASLLKYCQSVGLDVDIKSVEMKVKGDRADLTIYSRDNGVKKSKKVTPKTPPLRDEFNETFLSNASQESTLTLSSVAPLNGISEKEINTRLQQHFPNWASAFGKDRESFRKFTDLVNAGLKERVDREKASQGANISSILTQDFEYSDDEDDQKQKSEFNLPKEKIDSFVSEIFSDAGFITNAANIHGALTETARNPNPVQLPDVSNMFANKPPVASLPNPWFSHAGNLQLPMQFSNPFAPENNLPPIPSTASISSGSPIKSLHHDNGKNDSSRSSRHSKRRDRSPDSQGHSSDRKRRRRSRSPSSSDRDKERERRKNGLPSRNRGDETIVASRTLWFGRLPSNCSEQDIRNALKDSGLNPEKVNTIASRACAYVTMPNRRSACKIIDRHRDIRVSGRSIKIEWATGSGIQKNDKIMDYWDKERGFLSIPHKKLPKDLKSILEDNHLEIDTLPEDLKGKYNETGPIEDNEPSFDEINQAMQSAAEIPLPSLDQLPPLPSFPHMPSDATGSLPGLPSLAFPGFIQPNLLAAVLAQQQQQVPPSFENLFTALQQNQGLLPTPPAVGQPPNIFTNLGFDNNLDKQGSVQFRPRGGFDNQRGGFRPRGRGDFRPNFNRGGFDNQRGGFRPRGRGRGRGDFQQGEFRPRFPRRGNFQQNANFQPLAPFMHNNNNNMPLAFDQPDTSSFPPANIPQQTEPEDTSNAMDIDCENSLSS